MRRLNDAELDARIHTFLDRKFAAYPELRESAEHKPGWHDRPETDR